MSTSAATPALSAAPVKGRSRAPPRRGRAAFGRLCSRISLPAPGGPHLPSSGRNGFAPPSRTNAAVGSGAPAASLTGEDDQATFSNPFTRGLGNVKPVSSPSTNPASASASGFHFGSFPLESFKPDVASNALPLFRPRNGSLVARAQADDGSEGKKDTKDDTEASSDGDSDSDEEYTDTPGTSKGSSGGKSGDDPDVVSKKATEEDDSKPKKPKESLDVRSRAFFENRPELASAVVRFSETAEMLCLLTAGGVRVAQLSGALSGKERLLVGTGGSQKRSVDFVAAVGSNPLPSATSISLGKIGSFADGALIAAVGVHALVRRVLGGTNNVVSVPAGAAPVAEESVQFADVVSRVRARAALLADVKKDLATSRVAAEIAAKAAMAQAAKGNVVAGEGNVGVVSDDNLNVSSPTVVAARLEAKLARESAEATARHRDIEVSAANARAAAAEEMAQAARARAQEAEDMLQRRRQADSAREEWQTETEVRTINTTRSTRGGKGNWDTTPYNAYDANGNDVYGNESNSYTGNNAGNGAYEQPQHPQQLGPPSSNSYQDAVDAETVALREEVARLRRQASAEEEECQFENGYEGHEDECQ